MLLKPSGLTWRNREMMEGEGAIRDLRKEIPRFERQDFSVGENTNEYLRLIAREPVDSDYLRDREYMPVAAVSAKYYRLVQHDAVICPILNALEKFATEGKFVTDPQALGAKLRLSKYGARMWLTLLLPNCQFDPGDGYPIVLTLNCYNSVDKSVAVRIDLAWQREISGTEMMGREFRKVHNQLFKVEDIEEFLALQFRRLPAEQKLYRQWHETKIAWHQIVDWLGKNVAKIWGAQTALRAYHIAKAGEDLEVEDAYQIDKTEDGIQIVAAKLGYGPLQLETSDFITDYKLRRGFISNDEWQSAQDMNQIADYLLDDNPYPAQSVWWDSDPVAAERTLQDERKKRSEFAEFVVNHVMRNDTARFVKGSTTRKVPGLFAPVQNVYHLSQVLSWLASERETREGQLKTLEGRLQRLNQIPGLMDALLKAAKQPPRLRIGPEYKRQ